MDYSLIGPLRVVRDGEHVSLGGPKQRAVLAVLLLARGRVVEFDALIDAVWNDAPPVKAISSVRAYVANLRRALGADVLVTTSYGYRIELGESELDVDRFETLAARGRDDLAHGRYGQARSALGRALDIWSGQPLEDLRDLEIAVHETRRLLHVHADAVEAYFDSRLAVGHAAEIVGLLEAQLLETPLRERLWEQLMLALVRSGRRVDALLAFGRAREILARELALAPGDSLTLLEREIRTAQRGVPRTRTIGRDNEIEAIDDACVRAAAGRGSLVVVTGEPGIGKSSLAAEFLTRAEFHGSATAWSCPPRGVHRPPLWSWVQVLRALGSSVGREQLVSAADVLDPAIGEMLPGWPPSRNPGSARGFDVIDSVALTLTGLVASQPTLVVLDDLDGSDRATRNVVNLLAGDLRHLPLVLVCTGRGTLDRLTDRCDTTTMRLRGLDIDGVAAILGAASAESVRRVHRRTGGNPFYVRALLPYLDDMMFEHVVPDAVASVIRARTARLPARTRSALRDAARDGMEAPASGILDSAVREGILVESGTTGRVRFSCALVRDAVALRTPRPDLTRADVARVDATRRVRVASTATDALSRQLST